MRVPLEIAFHNTESSDWAETEIRGRVADLEKICDRLISCRVRVDQRATNSSGTIPRWSISSSACPAGPTSW